MQCVFERDSCVGLFIMGDKDLNFKFETLLFFVKFDDSLCFFKGRLVREICELFRKETFKLIFIKVELKRDIRFYDL